MLLMLTWMVAGILFSITALAQNKRVTGTVSADDGTPLPGVTVSIQGTSKAVATDNSGNFSIDANANNTLVFSYVGYETKSVKVVAQDILNVTLVKGKSGNMEEVVVTAMDIKRPSKELGFSTQGVSGKDVQEAKRDNFMNSLQGRVAGLTITPTSGSAGASTGIVLRGFNTLSGNNQPLFIVDGVILDNQTLNSNSQSGSGIGLASDGNNRNNDNTNRIADLNPSDIESITVLKGPEATALYGSQAGSGAMVITTKKAKMYGERVLLSYDNNFRVQKITRFVDVNNEYSPGTSNSSPTPFPLSSGTSLKFFGPKYADGTQLYDNLHHFFQTGFTQTHNVSAEFGATKNSGFIISGQVLNSNGVVPNNTYTKYNFKVSNTTKIGKYVTVNPTIAYVSAYNVRPIKGSGGFLTDLYQWPGTYDIRNNNGKYEKKSLLFSTNVNSDFDNPIWAANNNYSGDKLIRWIYTLGLDINPFPWLTLSGRFGYERYQNDGFVFTHPQSNLLSTAIGGSLDNFYRTYKGYNHTITATAKKNFGNISTRLMVGTMWQDYETSVFAVYGTNLKDSSRTDSSNTTLNTRRRLLRNYYGQPNMNIFRELAYFAEATIGFKDVAFLTYSHRFEKASPIPVKNNNYHYPGASLSLIISDIFPVLKRGNILDYAKLRGSLAHTARLNDPYSNQSFFVNNYSSTVLPVTYTYGYTNANPDLVPEKQRTYEIGTELRFLNNAISIDASYYNTLCTDQIAQGYRASYATGYVLNTQNAASLRNEGVEIVLNLNPIKRKNFNWNITFNYNHMWSKVLTLPASIDIYKDFYNSDTYISNLRAGLVRVHSTGTLTGSKYMRNTAGQILIDPGSGIPLVQSGNYVVADRTPKYTLGALNSFRYKNWTLSFLWDLKVGGDVYNGADQLLTAMGKSARTSNRTIPLIVNGVLNDSSANTATPTKNTLAIKPQYSSIYYSSLPDEEFIQKNVNWLRLRDFTITYRLPDKTVSRFKYLREVSLFITGSDLILITNYYGADPAVNANNPGTWGVGGYGMDLGSPATPIGVNFGFKVNF
jgi:TonB-linked SusC/RagA family outer membrane protein